VVSWTRWGSMVGGSAHSLRKIPPWGLSDGAVVAAWLDAEEGGAVGVTA
jgi:hypothetical protein